MIEANRAYAMGDEEQLRAILLAWDRSPEAVQGNDADAMRLRLERRIAQIEEQLEGLAGALSAVKESALWKLKVMVDDEAVRNNRLARLSQLRNLFLEVADISLLAPTTK